MERAYELEEEELAAEPIGRDKQRAVLFYETSEGGSGVLRRLVEEPNALAEVAEAALAQAHFDAQGVDQKPTCHAACYECLLSYSNQLEALNLNRHRVRELLLSLSHSRTLMRVNGRTWQEQLDWLRTLADTRSELERRFLDGLARGGYRLPNDAQHEIPEPRCVLDFFYVPNVCLFCDGVPHDEPEQRRRDQEIRWQLEERGYRVVVIRYDEDLLAQIRRHADILGAG